MSNIDFLIANVMWLLSNAKIILSQRGATDLTKKAFGSWTIMMKTGWKRQNSQNAKIRGFLSYHRSPECPPWRFKNRIGVKLVL